MAEGLVRYYDWVLDRISGSVGGRTLEVGAGIGTLSARVEPLTSELVLVEPAANLYRRLDERFAQRGQGTCVSGHTRPCSGRTTQTGSSSVSTRSLHSTCSNTSRMTSACSRRRRRCCALARSVVLFVPSLPILYGTNDALVNHYRRYTKSTLGTALRSAGLAMERLEYFDLFGHRPVVHRRSCSAQESVPQRHRYLRSSRDSGVAGTRSGSRPTPRQEPHSRRRALSRSAAVDASRRSSVGAGSSAHLTTILKVTSSPLLGGRPGAPHGGCELLLPRQSPYQA